MDCQHCQSQLSEYLDDALTGEPLQELETHLFRCSDCFLMFEGLQRLQYKIKLDFEEIPVPEGLDERIFMTMLPQIHAHKQGKQRQVGWTSLFLFAIGGPIVYLLFFSRVFSTLLQFSYTTLSAFARIIPTVMNMISPWIAVSFMGTAFVLAGSGIYLIRSLLHGLHLNEVF